MGLEDGLGEADSGEMDPSGAEQRDRAAGRRDQAADRRDQAATERDRANDERDQASDARDHTAEQRDQTAEQRDHAAEQRDQAAEWSETADGVPNPTDRVSRAARARRAAASDRKRASEDRRSGARARTQAEVDRNIAVADREIGASERAEGELDRSNALADRDASARELEDVSVDPLTGMYLRRAGFVELEREMARARRSHQSLVLAVVQVERLKVTQDASGLAAGDRMLVEVADALRAELRSYDLIIRHRDDGFVCAISGVTIAGAATLLSLVDAALARAPHHGAIHVGLAESEPEDVVQDLVTRAAAALSREGQERSGRATVRVWECGDLIVDEGTQSVTRAGSAIALTSTEFKMLTVLVHNKTLVVPKSQLLGQVWGYDANDHVLAVHMSSLRRKLEAHGPRMVHTIRGSGYLLRA